MFRISYCGYPYDELYETEDDAEEAIRWEISEHWEHHPTLRCEYEIEEVEDD